MTTRRSVLSMIGLGGAAAVAQPTVQALEPGQLGSGYGALPGYDTLPDRSEHEAFMLKRQAVRAFYTANPLPEEVLEGWRHHAKRYDYTLDEDLIAMKSLAAHTKRRLQVERAVARREHSMKHDWGYEEVQTAFIKQFGLWPF